MATPTPRFLTHLLSPILLALLIQTAHADTGVDASRLSLPEGAGSLEGVGENVEIDPNMGQMRYGVSVSVPEGYPGMTPSVGLSYGSGGGSGLVGIGWSMAMPSIERMTSRGLPEYSADDMFAAGGGQQLVRVSGGDDAVYRARFEGGFVRYTWKNVDDGAEGYWIAEFPDGRVGYFGADASGDLVRTARVGASGLGTFRYMLTEMVDVWGHTIRYTYRTSGRAALPTTIGYVFVDGNPKFQVVFNYEARPDLISDAKGGFPEILKERLSGIETRHDGIVLQRWALTYEDESRSGGFSRLAKVERFGLAGGRYPAVFDFQYSNALGGVCEGEGCQGPYLVEMAEGLGVDFQARNATLIDINGDSLPDLVKTTQGDNHVFFINTFRGVGDHTFSEGRSSTLGASANEPLSTGRAQPLDVDGDGFTDLLNTRTGNVLRNTGQGDWAEQYNLFVDGGLPDTGADLDPEDGDLDTIRFLDYDNDKRIDMIRSQGTGEQNTTQIFRNLPSGGFEVVDSGFDRLATGFDSNRLQLADINGDGMLDLALLQDGSLTVQINLGRGRWTSPTPLPGMPFNDVDLPFVELEDLNNDGLADLVMVRADTLTYALGRGDASFDPPVALNPSDLPGMPVREATTTVLFADMNGSGSTDVVWISRAGDVTYLELFPVQPHLLSRITNGLGLVSEVTYSTSVELSARDAEAGQPWAYKLPFPMVVVTEMDVYDTHSNIHQRTTYAYRDGFYDGQEKQFRGFARVDVESLGDETIETGTNALTFDLGDGAPERAGLLLRTESFSAGRPIQTIETTHESCPLDDLPAPDTLDFSIRYVCPSSEETTLKEGMPEADWVTTRIDRRFDGYGNLIEESRHGVTSVGGGACAPCDRDEATFGTPCGDQCLGDETYAEADYVHVDDAGGRWIIGKPSKQRIYGQSDSDAYAEKTIHYDGPDFVGLPAGQLTHGSPTRIESRIDEEGNTIPDLRVRKNSHGHVVEQLQPEGDLADQDNHRVLQTFDDAGLRVVGIEMRLRDRDGQPYSLVQRAEHDAQWSVIASVSEWIVVKDGAPLSTLRTEQMVYDEFGRTAERYYATDASDAPSERVTYELGNPISRIITERRSVRGGEFDLATVQCFDGAGRLFQERERADETTWIVNGFVVFNRNGSVRRGYERTIADSGQCDAAPPENVTYEELTYDAIGRTLTDTWSHDTARLVRSNVYTPLVTLNFDFDDKDPDAPGFETPTRHEFDGLGRNTRVTKMLSETESVTFNYLYDPLGHYQGYEGPEGHESRRFFDLAGRVLRIDDPDRGTTTQTLDARGQIMRKTDALGTTLAYDYDGLGRLVATWDVADPEDSLIEYRYDLPGDCALEQCTNVANRLVGVGYPLGEHGRGEDRFGYDSGGKMVFQSRSLKGRRFEFGWQHDNAGGLIRQTFPTGDTIDYDLDDAGRLRTIDGVVDTVTYNGAGLPEEVQLANGTTDLRQFDLLKRMTSHQVRGERGPLLSLDYTYDAVGNVLEVVDNTASGQRPSHSAAFTYDGFNRLTSARLDAGREGLDERLVYTYDLLGNIRSKTSSDTASPDHIGDYSYGANAGPHAVTQAGGLTMAYDAAGQMIQRGDLGLSWDAWGRQVRAERGGEVVSRSYYSAGYDRVLHDTEDGLVWTLRPDFEIRDGVAAIYTSLNNHHVARRDTLALATTVLSDVAPLNNVDGQINVADAWIAHQDATGGVDLDQEGVDPSARLLRAALSRLLTEDGQTTFLHSDHRETTVLTTDAEGNVLEGLTYYPHGQLRGASSGDSVAHYNSKEQESATGLVYFGARHLDPQLGRWISPDPHFQEPDSPNIIHHEEATGAYVSMANNPIRYHDRDGQFIGEIIGIFAGDVLDLSIRGAAGAVGAGVGAYDYYRETKIENAIAGRETTKAQLIGWTAFGFVAGGTYGFLSKGTTVLANVGDLGLSYAFDRLTRGVLSRNLSPQAHITTRRMVRTMTYAAVSIGVAVGLSAITGGAFPVAAVAFAAGWAGIKLIGYAIAHRNGFSRAGGWLKRKFSRKSRTARKTSVSVGPVDGAIVSAGLDVKLDFKSKPKGKKKRRLFRKKKG